MASQVYVLGYFFLAQLLRMLVNAMLHEAHSSSCSQYCVASIEFKTLWACVVVPAHVVVKVFFSYFNIFYLGEL